MTVSERIGYFVLPILVFIVYMTMGVAMSDFAYSLVLNHNLPYLFITLFSDLVMLLLVGCLVKFMRLKVENNTRELSHPEICVIGTVIVLTWYFGGTCGDWFAAFFDDSATQAYNELLGDADVITLLVLTLVVGPLVEEVLLRTLTFTSWSKAFSPRVAAVLSAALFSAMHMTVMHVYFTFVLGLVLAYVQWKTGSLKACYLTHLAFNCYSFTFGVFGMPEFFRSPFVWGFMCIAIFIFVWKVFVDALPAKRGIKDLDFIALEDSTYTEM